MDLSLYRETELEQWVYHQYHQHGFRQPADLDIDCIAAAFGIDIIYYDHHSFSCNVSGVIFLNKNLDEIEMRDIFFHELCHVLRHVGDQRIMPRLFEQRQEMESGWFQRYAAMPFYMIEQLGIPPTQREAVDMLAYEFKVSHQLAKDRLDQIERRLFESQLWEENRKMIEPQKEEQKAWSLETLRILNQLNKQVGAKA